MGIKKPQKTDDLEKEMPKKILPKDEGDKLGEFATRRIISQKINQITDGLFSTLVDFTLYSLLLLPSASFGKSATSRGVYQSFREADEMLTEVNYRAFKNALRKLKEKGFLENIKEWGDKKIATRKGRKRLESILPFYDEKRFWDGNLYIVQYDIPVGQTRLRNLFREFLKKLGAIKLQESSYLLFYNPQNLIGEFLKDHQQFTGNILVSKLNKDGFLGEENIIDFLWSRSGLDRLNLEYEEFTKKYKEAKKNSPQEMLLHFFSILKKDPQIPFELLPPYYLGDQAYLLFLKYTKNTPFHEHVYKK